MKTATGLDLLTTEPHLQKKHNYNIAYLCHNASIDAQCTEGIYLLKNIFGNKLKAIFSPQHGLSGEAQDNMIETNHFIHPFYKIPVHSLYSETRTPTDKMLENIDHVIIDLQDVGCRAYTFVYTMILMMEACGKKDIEVTVLDRPNPLNGLTIEGNMLENKFSSFIGLHPLPMRHGLTIGEIANMAVKYWEINCPLKIIKTKNWQRHYYFEETGLPWVFPSPNMPSLNTVKVFPGTVIFEGTNISEGRGTTCPFEIFGHPAIKPHELLPQLNNVFKKNNLKGFTIRPIYFQPTFDKYANTVCGGFQIHVLDNNKFQPWRTGLVLLRELFHYLGETFEWRQPPFEYEEKLLPIDMLNGSDQLRTWVEKNGEFAELDGIERTGMGLFLEKRKETMLY